MKEESSKELTRAILLIAAVGLLVPALAVAPGLGYALKPFLKNKKYYPSRIKRNLNRLEKQELVSIREEEDNIRIELSKKGKLKVLSYKIKDLELKKDKWDGWWRIVIFDIPEKNRVARDFLRFRLKELNFYMLQKSVLVTPWECRDIIDFVKHNYFVSDYVYLILAKKFDGDDKVRNYFGL